MPNDANLKKKIPNEACSLGYNMHRGDTKMWRDMRALFVNNMKKIAKYVVQ